MHVRWNLTRSGCRLEATGLVAVCLFAAVGCGRPSSIALAPCAGIVTLDGKPVEGWYISFHPDHEQSTRGPASLGLTDQSGAFEMLAPGRRAGAVVGHHRVFLSPPEGDLPPVTRSNPAAVSVPPV